MFKPNDRVSHPGHGACCVNEICERDITGEKVTYYKLTPYTGGAVVYVPVDKAEAIGVRPLITRQQATDLLASLTEARESWISDTMEKQRRYRSLQTENTIQKLSESLSMMSAILRQKTVKELGSADKTILQNVQNKAMSEIAMAMDISYSEATQRAEAIIFAQ